MNCEEIKNLLPDFDEGALSPITVYAMQDHLKTCESCTQELEQIRELYRALSDNNLQQPSASLRENFNKMLDEEMEKQKTDPEKKVKAKIISMPWRSYTWRAAAAIAIFSLGIFFGKKWKHGADKPDSNEIASLKKDVNEVKEMLMFNQLKEESASARIKAVNYVDEMPNPNQKVLNALINTLNYDKNVNVRLASLYSLAKFTDLPLVRDSLVSSLSKQTEPVIQVVLINLLSEKKETKAIKPIQDIISNSNTLKEVKAVAVKSLKSL
ncbi:MAG TPA: zf-HC2 domain-containing protein [Puia sp.]|nr:zf-HC2 domain-containing protein [Puia sp.]